MGNEDIASTFNSHYAQKLLLTVEELRTEDSRGMMATLKRITGAPRLSVHAKGATAFQSVNRLKLICASNDTNPVAMEDDDSRWVQLQNFERVTESHKRKLAQLFTGRGSGVLSPLGLAEVQALAWDLKHARVDWDLADTPLENEARRRAMEASRESPQQFFDAVDQSSLDHLFIQYVPTWGRDEAVFTRSLELEGKPDHTAHAALYGIYQAFCKARGLRAFGSSKFSAEVERYRPEWQKDRPNVYRADGTRERVSAWTGIPRNRAARNAVSPLPVVEPEQASSPAPEPHAPTDLAPHVQAVMDVFGPSVAQA